MSLIGSGAQLLGPINIGNNSRRIGANAVVLNDVPTNQYTWVCQARKVRSKKCHKFFKAVWNY